MEPTLRNEVPKLADMVMCGDHSSVTKTELNVKEIKSDDKNDKEMPKERSPMFYARISPTSSRTGRERPISEHALRVSEARRRTSLDVVHRPHVDLATAPNRVLLQAALAAARWPPYLAVVWAAAVVATHALHGLVGLLERALPPLKKSCEYLYSWSCESCRSVDHSRVSRCALCLVTGLLYVLYGALCGALAAALWALCPLYEDHEHAALGPQDTQYAFDTKTSSSL